MHPLHDYVAKQLADRLKNRRVLVWYDPRRDFAGFFREIHQGGQDASAMTIGGLSTRLVEFDGSFFAVRAAVEDHVAVEKPAPLLIYVPGAERDLRGSVLMELEKAGAVVSPPEQTLKKWARFALKQKFTDSAIDEMLAPERLTYEDLAAAASQTNDDGMGSVLKALFKGATGDHAILATWLLSSDRDAGIEDKEAQPELAKLIDRRLGLKVPAGALTKWRAITTRYVLAGEFRSDLSCPPPSSLASLPQPGKDQLPNVRDVAHRMRGLQPAEYEKIADHITDELGLAQATLPAHALGSIDTFRFEERTLLQYCGELIVAGKFSEAEKLIVERERSFWLDRDPERKAQWEACRRMATLGAVAIEVRAAIAKFSGGSRKWVETYAAKDGWHRLDFAQRRLEVFVATLPEDVAEKPLGVVRRAYDDACSAMAQGFSHALEKSAWAVPGVLHQTRIYSDEVAKHPKPVAFFLVDAMRFEMGVELEKRLPKTAGVALRPAIGSLPSITPIGMAALLPGASASFSVVEQGGKLGAKIDDSFLPELKSRKSLFAARTPGSVDMTLDELLTIQPSKLAKKVDGAPVVVVRSQEIDHAGEAGFSSQSHHVMDNVISNIVRGLRRLSAVGVEDAVISADHGHLIFPTDRDESMRIDAPGGKEVDLHRRCWIGRGGTTPKGCVRIPASALGYASDLEFVFPEGAGVFRAGGDLAFHHGGMSLQELVIPVLAVRLKREEVAKAASRGISIIGIPERITNRIFSVTLQVGEKLDLFGTKHTLKPLLVAKDIQVGSVFGVVGEAELDRTLGTVTLKAATAVTVAFLLSRDDVPALRIVVQDPATDAELYRSPHDIPVQVLGV